MFNRLPQKRQLQLVVDEGVLVGQRTSENFSIYLYAVDGFYAEVYFFRSSGEYARMRPINDMDQLDPYLVKINLGELLEKN